MGKFISYEESQKRLRESFGEILGSERVFLSESLGRVLAVDIVAPFSQPEFETASMDGYAIRYEDQKLRKLKVVGRVPAGSEASGVVESGSAVKTFTGSMVTKGADTIIPIENVEYEDGYIRIIEEVEKGFSVRPIGESFVKGEKLIEKGAKISFAEIGVMASLNITQVEVTRKPVVSIIATGSEILEVGEGAANSSQIVSSNHFTLEALAKMYGSEVIRVGVVKDNQEIIKSKITQALESSDIVVTTGGVSVGDYDFVKEILGEFEADFITTGVVIKPGQHIKILKIGKKYIFSLPGFPYSSTVTFALYVLPLIKHLQGLNPTLHEVEAILEEDYKKKSKKTEFAAANIRYEGGKYLIDFKDKRSGSSAILNNMLGNCALIEICQNCGDLKKGDRVKAILL
jgi:molybdopterin molybdotransferase